MKTRNSLGFRSRTFIALIAALTLSLALAACSSPSSSSSSSASSASQSSASAVSSSASAASGSSTSSEAQTTGIKVNITAADWDKYTSTPMIAAIEPFVEGTVDVTPLYRTVNANEPVSIDLAAGIYKVTFISGVNMDGSIYTFPDTKEVTATTLDDSSDILDIEATLVPAADVTSSQMEHVIAATTVASASLDGGDDANLEEAVKNAQNAPEVPVEQIEGAVQLGHNALNDGTASDITLNIPPQNRTAGA